MDTSRRDVLRAAVLSPLLAVPADVFAGVSRNEREPNPENVSESVVSNATRVLIDVLQRGHAADAADYQRAAVVTRILFDHLTEAGYSGRQKDRVVQYLSGDGTIPAAVVDDIERNAREKGANLGPEVLEKMRHPARSQLASVVADGRLSEILTQVPSRFEWLAARRGGVQALETAHSQDAFDDMCRELHLVVDTLAAIAAIDGVGCMFGCVFCCPIAAAFGVAAALLQLAVDWIC